MAAHDLLTAQQLHQSGNLDEAERIYRRLLELEPGNAEALHLLGVAQFQRGQIAEAVDLLGKSLQLRPDNAPCHNHLGAALAMAGHLDAAIGRFQQALSLDPQLADAHYNLGNVFRKQKRRDEAVAAYRRAVQLVPNFAAAHYNLGNELREQGRLDEAIAHYEHALKVQPNYAKARRNLIRSLMERGDDLVRRREPGKAAALFRRASQLNPDSADAHARLASALAAVKRHDEAIVYYRRALELKPDFAEAHLNLGASLQAQKNYAQAEEHYQHALRLKPGFPEAYCNLGSLCSARERYADALLHYEQALRRKPDFAGAYTNRGNALWRMGRYEEALESYRQALRLKPDDPQTHCEFGKALHEQRKITEAIASYDEALRLDPQHAEAHLGRAFAWLRQGDFQRGWPEYEWRFKCEGFGFRYPNLPRWDGAPLEGRTLLVKCEQGLGDVVQFVRFIPVARARGGRVVLECPKALTRLLQSFAGIDQLVSAGDPLPPCDVWIPLLSLPAVLGTRVETIPAEVPYLAADPALVEHWRHVLAPLGGFKIGVAWRGNPDMRRDHERSFPLVELETIARLPEVRLISLQKKYGLEELSAVDRRFPVTDLGSGFDEAHGPFMDTAAVMQNLDLVISCDTVIGHLAGALGVPCWLALAHAYDFRWLDGRRETPWYPQHRLFPQPRFGDWPSVFEAMEAELRSRLPGVPEKESTPVLHAETSPGELIDRITILRIKARRIADPDKLRNVHRALRTLEATRNSQLPTLAEVEQLAQQLLEVNEALWDVEDELRECERRQDFGSRFVELARSVYRFNDRRAALKRQIDQRLGSALVEEKSYAPYEAEDEPEGTGRRDS